MNHRHFGGTLALVITLSSGSFAEDNTSILVNGFGTNIPATLTIGSTGTNNSLQITLGGSVTNDAGVIGDGATASNNFVLVDGAGSLWTNTISGGFDGVIVGRSGDNNSLTISAGGRVDAQDGILGRFGGADNNSILITGSNSFLNITRFFDVGTFGSGNQLVITNGGRLNNANEARIGGVGGAINNSVLITGAGSIWSNTANLKVGAAGAANNSVTVANGGTLRNTLGFIGESVGANSNSVTVTGAGSRWINTGAGGESINVGRGGSYNQLIVSDGGRVDGADIYLGRFGGADSNSVLVTGANSLLNLSTYVDVGTAGDANQLTVMGGGRLVNVNEARIGAFAGADGNSVVISGSGSIWSNSANLKVGSDGSGNRMVVSNGAFVVNTSAIIGEGVASINNSVVVTGAGSVWSNTAASGIQVGRFGDNNQLTVSDGATVHTFELVVGRFGGSDNNTAVVTGTNSLVNIMDTFTAGGSLVVGIGANNQLTISNGGRVKSANETDIGAVGGSDNNQLLLTGSGSVWTNMGGAFDIVKVGAGDSLNNRLVVSNGAHAVFGRSSSSTISLAIGDGSGARSNVVIVTGAGSLVTNTGYIHVGNVGSQNQLVISDGATVHALDVYTGRFSGSQSNTIVVTGNNSLFNITRFFDLGTLGGNNRLVVSDGGRLEVVNEVRIGATAGTDNNIATVTGAGARWNNQNNLVVGDVSTGNQLIVSNSGTVYAPQVLVGRAASGSGSITVAGGVLLVTNSGGTANLVVGQGGAGTVTLNSGSVTADRVFVTNGASSTFTLNGGTLNSRNTTVNNGSAFTIGNGASATALNLVGGSHSFANGVNVSSNGTIMGTGAVVDNTVTVNDGGNFSPGASPGTLTVNNLTLNPGSQLNFELGPHNLDGSAIVGGGTNDLGVVTGAFVLDGILNVTDLAGFGAIGSGAASTNVYRLFNYSGSLTDNGLTIGAFPSYAVGFIDMTTPGQVNLFVIPEPSVVALLGFACAILIGRRRRGIR